jgi:rubredoxin
MAAFRVREINETPAWEAIIAAAPRAVTPMRRPDGSAPQQQHQQYTEEQPLPSARRSDLMAPKRVGIWAVVPYVAAMVVVGAAGFVAAKKFQVRQATLVEDFGEVMIYYGNTPEAMAEIVSDYKRKLGPGILRQAMYRSYLRQLVTEKALEPLSITNAAAVRIGLRLSDKSTVAAINELGTALKDAPSLLGKLLFVANRILPSESLPSLELLPLFPYPAPTVLELQRNMGERCLAEIVTRALEKSPGAAVPVDAANTLRISLADADAIFATTVKSIAKAVEAEAAVALAAASEVSSMPEVGNLDMPARDAEPTKADVHAYQCSECGYTMFPAAGREFKFFGDGFACPTCQAPKDKFIDLNAEE